MNVISFVVHIPGIYTQTFLAFPDRAVYQYVLRLLHEKSVDLLPGAALENQFVQAGCFLPLDPRGTRGARVVDHDNIYRSFAVSSPQPRSLHRLHKQQWERRGANQETR